MTGEPGTGDESPSTDRSGCEDVTRDELIDRVRADALVRGVVREFGSATSTDEIDDGICERLVEHGDVRLAWTGEREGGDDRIVPGTVAGDPEQAVRDALETVAHDDASDDPVRSAVESGAVQVVEDVREVDGGFCSPDEGDAGLRSMAVIPVVHGDTVQGVVAVYGDRQGGFDDALTDRFVLIGEAIGFAKTAVQTRQLLEQDAAVELEFHSQSDDAWLVWLARACSCRLETAGSVNLDEDVLEYLDVTGGSPDDVAAAATQQDEVVGSRVVRSADGDGGVVELRTSKSLHCSLADAGARLVSAVAKPDGTEVVVEVPRDADVRTVHERVRESNPDAKLVTKTEREPAAQADSPFDPESDVLTERQREVLQAAFMAGYYAWPRDTTAEELADSLDIASPTLHQHLRRAERNILRALFDESDLGN